MAALSSTFNSIVEGFKHAFITKFKSDADGLEMIYVAG